MEKVEDLKPLGFTNDQLKTGGVMIGVTLLAFIVIKLYFRGGVCRVKRDLSGRVAVVTGGNGGIGKETIIELVAHGCRVIFGSRDTQKNQTVVKEIRKRYKGAQIECYKLDLASKESIRQFANNVTTSCRKIDFMINNAGILGIPTRKFTKDGFQMQFGVNHLGHFYLNSLLWQLIKKADQPRVISVSALAHRMVKGKLDLQNLNGEKEYQGLKAYAYSKLSNILYIRQLQRKMDQAGMRNAIAISLHPGVIITDIGNNVIDSFWKKTLYTLFKTVFFIIPWLFCKSINQGVQTTIYGVFEDISKLKKGEYYSDCKVAISSQQAKNMEKAELLWRKSQELLNIKFDL